MNVIFAGVLLDLEGIHNEECSNQMTNSLKFVVRISAN